MSLVLHRIDFEKLDYPQGPFFLLSKVSKSLSLENSDNLITAFPHYELLISYQKCTLKSHI